MKNVFLAITALLFFAECKKSTNLVNSITITDNGKTYTTNTVDMITIRKNTANSTITWQTTASSGFPFAMLMGARGPINSLGLFETFGTLDTTSVNYYNIGGIVDTTFNTRSNNLSFRNFQWWRKLCSR